MPTDSSTAVLMEIRDTAKHDKNKNHHDAVPPPQLLLHQNSDSVLRLLPCLGFPYNWLGPLVLWLVPASLRDWGYQLFARNRGAIWKRVKQVTGRNSDTNMNKYRDRIVGLQEPIDPGWGFSDECKW